MRMIFRAVFVLTTVLCFSPLFAEPTNFSLLKKEIQNYHDSGAYEKELTGVITKAHAHMLHQVEKNNLNKYPKKLAIVLDIDETSLTNYDKMIKREFVGNHSEIHQEILKANAPPIKATLFLYQDALKHGVSVFFVTGRHLSELDATKTNLLRAGYKGWSGLYLRPDNYHQVSIVPFKAHARALISKKGYTIIATIGDQYSDLIGGYAKKEFKLPNPFYYLP